MGKKTKGPAVGNTDSKKLAEIKRHKENIDGIIHRNFIQLENSPTTKYQLSEDHLAVFLGISQALTSPLSINTLNSIEKKITYFRTDCLKDYPPNPSGRIDKLKKIAGFSAPQLLYHEHMKDKLDRMWNSVQALKILLEASEDISLPPSPAPSSTRSTPHPPSSGPASSSTLPPDLEEEAEEKVPRLYSPLKATTVTPPPPTRSALKTPRSDTSSPTATRASSVTFEDEGRRSTEGRRSADQPPAGKASPHARSANAPALTLSDPLGSLRPKTPKPPNSNPSSRASSPPAPSHRTSPRSTASTPGSELSDGSQESRSSNCSLTSHDPTSRFKNLPPQGSPNKRPSPADRRTDLSPGSKGQSPTDSTSNFHKVPLLTKRESPPQYTTDNSLIPIHPIHKNPPPTSGQTLPLRPPSSLRQTPTPKLPTVELTLEQAKAWYYENREQAVLGPIKVSTLTIISATAFFFGLVSLLVAIEPPAIAVLAKLSPFGDPMVGALLFFIVGLITGVTTILAGMAHGERTYPAESVLEEVVSGFNNPTNATMALTPVNRPILYGLFTAPTSEDTMIQNKHESLRQQAEEKFTHEHGALFAHKLKKEFKPTLKERILSL